MQAKSTKVRKAAKTSAKKSHKISFGRYPWWQLGLFAVGASSFVAIMVVLFLPIGKGPTKFEYSGLVPSVSDPNFVHTIAASLSAPLKQGEPIEVINNGDSFLKSFLTDIDAARSSIDIMVYIWTDGKMSDQILEHLNQKLRQGVQVRNLDQFLWQQHEQA